MLSPMGMYMDVTIMFNKKTAICLSGIPKFWDKALHSIHTWFPEADIFIHTWLVDLADLNIHTVHDIEYYKTLNSDYNNFNKIIECFKPKNICIEDFNIKQSLFLKQKQKYIDAGIDDNNLKNTSQLSMFYSIREACNIKTKYELDNNIKYDIVVRMRFDSDIHYFSLSEPFTDNNVYIPYGSDWTGINDQFSFGDSNIMNIVCNCYTAYDACVSTTKRYSPEINFAEHLRQNNIFNNIKRENIQIGINTRAPI
jgi:hypothetical protein